ncbi:hypothetical protein KEM56_002004, partial [Ascosphaera pollenicola]
VPESTGAVLSKTARDIQRDIYLNLNLNSENYAEASKIELFIQESAFMYRPNSKSRDEYCASLERQLEEEKGLMVVRQSHIEDEVRRCLQHLERFQARVMLLANRAAKVKSISQDEISRISSLTPEEELLAAREY